MKTEKFDVIIIGGGLTGLTTAFYLKSYGKKVCVIEKNDRVGGQIKTYQEDGFIFESGPNTGAISRPEVAELFEALSPDCELEIARKEAALRLIWKGKCFHALPSGLWGGIITPLITWYDKFRIWAEPFRKKGTNPHESVGELARRRLGKSYLKYCVDPFVSGVYAGDPMKLTTRYAIPKLYNLEQEYGSFIKGAIAKAKQEKSERDKKATKEVFSVKNGLENLINTLVKRIGKENIVLSAKNIEVNPFSEGWEITFEDKEKGKVILEAEKVGIATGAKSMPELLPFVEKEKMDVLTDLEYAPVIQASVGVKDTGKLKFNAFGGLVPSCEKKDVLGILYPSACFSGRAPENGVLFSFFMGGVKRREILEYTDEEIKKLVEDNFHSMLKFPSHIKPDLIKVFRHPCAIPQYGQNTGKRLEVIEELENQYKGLIIGGNIKDGIGMADRIKQGREIADFLADK